MMAALATGQKAFFWHEALLKKSFHISHIKEHFMSILSLKMSQQEADLNDAAFRDMTTIFRQPLLWKNRVLIDACFSLTAAGGKM